MCDQYVVLKRTALAGVDRIKDRAEAEQSAAQAAIKDGEPRLVVQLHAVATRKITAELQPADAEVANG